MDVSRVDPEDALVDFETVEADISGEIDIDDLRNSGQEDKVLVSIRYAFEWRNDVLRHID